VKKAIILLSGGLDSATVLAMAVDQKYECYAISFDYGQRHSFELTKAKELADFFHVKEHLIVKFDLRTIGGSALTSDMAVPKDRSVETMSKDIPVTYVPARNTVFLSFALSLAEARGVNEIHIGANSLDYSGYPDCRKEYLDAFGRMANLATKEGVAGNEITIKAPLIQMTKKEIIETGLALGVDYSMTSSCYDPDVEGRPCECCDACLLRIKGFSELNMKDPVL
jgi:7-cyano-7-deazaguanine synthase